MVDVSHRPEQPKELLKFLAQFETIKSRWRNQFEEGTYNLIANGARYQRDLLNLHPHLPVDERHQLTLVATLLRCLVMSNQVFDLENNWSNLMVIDESDILEVRSEGTSDYWGLESTITVQRHPASSRRSIHDQVRRYPQGLPVTLKGAVRIMQQMMFKRRPQDFPCLIYSLSILDLVAHALRPRAPFFEPIVEGGHGTLAILETLCDLYLLCSDNVHPLCQEFDISRYRALVDNDPIAVDHFSTLHQLWEYNGRIVLTCPLTITLLTVQTPPRFRK